MHGWPQTWYAWRMLMPTLATDFSVVAVDQSTSSSCRGGRTSAAAKAPAKGSGTR
ncbi:MAG TPA: hypothetical protein VGQ26_26955 [Streptosporangiaceae bacterium]|nr:hypothetical protein [Streptosporangiaceae bacterium]